MSWPVFRWLKLMLFFFQAEDGIRDLAVTGVQTCALPICVGEGVVGHPADGAVTRVLGAPQRVVRRVEHLNGVADTTFFKPPVPLEDPVAHRSEERRVGKEGRSRWAPYH